MMTVPIVEGVSSFASRYDAMILDMWGLIHDGVAPYPGVPECLDRIRDNGIRTLFLSNAPRPSDKVVERLQEMGIHDDQYERVITSGDITRDALTRRYDDWHAALGARCLLLGPERDWGLVEGLEIEMVDKVESADFLLNTGLYDDETEGLADYAGRLSTAAERELPMVCANPDLTVMRGEKTVLCAGSLAMAYEEMGGDVRYHGKPHMRPYEFCFEALDGIPRDRIVAAGDSLRTDIAGANAAGIDGVFVMGGLHADELFGDGEGNPSPILQKMVADSGHRPVAALSRFNW
jgi:HAD superfamily hydrolase (TIGR01459 family)